MATTNCYSLCASPLGELVLCGDGERVTGVYLPEHQGWRGIEAQWQRTDAPFEHIRAQLAEYFVGKRQQFDVPLKLVGTPFQKRVWQELQRIPFGHTITYGQLATRLGQPTASRAVGYANGKNPVSILVPCHRVIGASGKLTGYAGGVEKKSWLLDWERQLAGKKAAVLFA